MRLYVLIIFLLPWLVIGQINPYADLDYDKVVAYEFHGMGEHVITYCLEHEPKRIQKAMQLNTDQIKEFEGIITSKTAYGSTVADCFDPHFAVVYFSKDMPVASIDVCLMCNFLTSTKDIPSAKHNTIEVTDDYSYPAKGFSPVTRKKLHVFIKNLGFTKYLLPLNSIFDE